MAPALRLRPALALPGPAQRPAGQRRPLVTRAFRAHLPIRPVWRCRACAAGWPCPPARLTLLSEYAGNRLALTVYLATLMHEAVRDLYEVGHRPDPRALHERFLAWATPRR